MPLEAKASRSNRARCSSADALSRALTKRGEDASAVYDGATAIERLENVKARGGSGAAYDTELAHAENQVTMSRYYEAQAGSREPFLFL